MPYPAQINQETIIAAARALLEQHGVEHLSLRLLAEHLGVKAPSLYRHVRNKTALLLSVKNSTLRELFDALYAALEQGATPTERILSVGQAYRRYAHQNPACYGLIFTNTIPELLPDAEAEAHNEQLVLPLQALFAQVSGEAASLAGLRGLLGLLHGWVTLELATQFRRGGDLDAHFEQAIRAYLRGW